MNQEEISIHEILDSINQRGGNITSNNRIAREFHFLWEHGINRISDNELRMAVKRYYLHCVPVEFYSAPSSVGGNHHPWWHNDQAGIVRHLTECCVMADRLLRCYGFVEGDGEVINSKARDIVLAATVITDTQKNGIPWGEKTLKNHGEIAANAWRDIAFIEFSFPDYELVEAVAEAVHWHYGRYTQVPKGEERKSLLELPPLIQIVHLLDSCSANGAMATLYTPLSNLYWTQVIES